MLESANSVEVRLTSLTAEVNALRTRVDGLSDQLEQLALQRVAARETGVASGRMDEDLDDFAPPESVSNALAQVVAPGFLTNVAMVCLLLVIALVLRTIVDTGQMNQFAGALLGLSYAGILMAYGGALYLRGLPRAAMYTTSGLVLILSIVFETHTIYRLIPTMAAYGILGAILIPVTILGARYRANAPVYTGLLGGAACGIGLEFPNPEYPVLGLLLLAANGCAFAVACSRTARLLVMSMLVETMFFWLLWATKAHAALVRGLGELEAVFLPWYLPLLAVFSLTYAAVAVWSVYRAGGRPGLLSLSMPVMNVLWAYGAARVIVVSWLDQGAVLGATGVVVSVMHLGFAVWAGRQGDRGVRASVSFAIAGAVLLVWALPACLPSAYWAVPICSLAALSFSGIARRQNVPPNLVVASVLQGTAVVMAMVSGMIALSAPVAGIRSGLLLFTGVCAFAHFGWPGDGTTSRSGAVYRVGSMLALLSGVVCLFGSGRIILYTLVGDGGDGVSAAFVAGESLILNAMAAVLMVLALRSRNPELLAGAIIVGVGTAIKVFGYDLLNTQDVPRVMSVASSGLVAGLGSYVRSRWQQAR